MNFVLSIVLALFLSQIALPSSPKWEKVFKPRQGLVKSIGNFHDVIFIGTGNGVFISKDSGKSWEDFGSSKLQKDFTGNSLINWIYIDEPQEKIYIATSFGAYSSNIHEPNWQKIFENTKTEFNEVNSVGVFDDKVYLPTNDGLWICSDLCNRFNQGIQADSLKGDHEVFFVLNNNDDLFLGASSGVYWFNKKSQTFERKSNGIQSLINGRINARHLIQDKDGNLWAACSSGIYLSKDNGENWKDFSYGIGKNEDGFQEVFYLKEINGELYAASASGVYVLRDNKWDEVSFGIRSKSGLKNVYWLENFHEKYYAATDEGLFVFEDTKKIILKGKVEKHIAHLEELEPSVIEVQKEALKFASLPTTNDYKRYRAQARMRNLIPRIGFDLNTTGTRLNYFQLENELSAGASLNNAFNADKTTRFQQDGKSFKQVSVLWNINQLFYDDEIREILNQARLTANIKENLLDDVTRIYFQRRKLQLENLVSPPEDIDTKLSNDLQVMELTGQLDSRTGGWFSREVMRRKELYQ